MNVATNSQPGGWKSFPADLKGGNAGDARLNRSTDAFKTPGVGDFLSNFLANNQLPVVTYENEPPPSQPLPIGFWPTLPGGDCPPGYICGIDLNTGRAAAIAQGNWGYQGGSPTVAARTRTVYRPGMSGLGMTAQEIAELIKTGAQTTLPLLVAQTPGTIYTQLPDGTIQVYSQPTGTTANLPGVYGSALLQGGANIQPSGSVTLPGGATAQANFGNMGEMMPLLVIGGLLAFVVFAGRK